jgi:hypothetical protein
MASPATRTSTFGRQDHVNNDRDKALDIALAAIDKQFGKGSIMRMGEKSSMASETIQNGALALALDIGVVGRPGGAEVGRFGHAEDRSQAAEADAGRSPRKPVKGRCDSEPCLDEQ